MLVLLDLDGVLADFERGFLREWERRYPDEPAVPLEERRTFAVRDNYPECLAAAVEGIYCAPGFFSGLDPIPGALAGARAMLEHGHDVWICTSPLTKYENCVAEKYQWVDRQLGPEFVSRMIVTKDKTLVRGDVLIDDKPQVVGAMAPTWRHIVFDQPYNRGVSGPRMNWSNWELVLDE